MSSLFYLLASLVDPGFLPKPDLTAEVLASFSKTAATVREGREGRRGGEGGRSLGLFLAFLAWGLLAWGYSCLVGLKLFMSCRPEAIPCPVGLRLFLFCSPGAIGHKITSFADTKSVE